MITVRVDGARIPFEGAASYDYIQWQVPDGTSRDSLTLFDAEGNRLATFYKWDGVDAGETP